MSDRKPKASSSIWRNRNLNLLWFGEGISVTGSIATTVVLPLAAIAYFDAGPTLLGVMAASFWVPWLLIGLPAGAWDDQADPRRVMMTADIVSALAIGSIPLALWMGRATPAFMCAAVFVAGTAAVLFATSYHKLVRSLVPDEQLEPANSRIIGTDQTAAVVGPGIGGWLAHAFSAAGALAIDAVSFVVSFVSLGIMRTPGRPSSADDERDPIGERIKDGIRLVWRDRYLRWFTLLGGLTNFAMNGFQAILVLLLVRHVGLSDGGVGTFFMVASIGGVAGSILAPWVGRTFGTSRAVVGLAVLGGVAGLGIGFVERGAALVVVGASMLALIGCVACGNVLRSSWRQRYVPESKLGRVIAASQVVNYGMVPVGSLAGGLLGGLVGVRPAVITMTVVHAAVCFALLLSPFTRLRDLPRPATPPVQPASR